MTDIDAATFAGSARPPRSGLGGTLGPVFDGLGYEPDSAWAWDNYEASILALARRLGAKDLCEIGAGRDPLVAKGDLDALGARLTLNDISAGELALAPAGYPTACFDVGGDLDAAGVGAERFDLMFSRMVFEHLPDTRAAWRNTHRLLRPGGVALAFFPTLFALPFAVNHALPERVTGPLLRALHPNRADEGGDPKFPAVYDHCRGAEAAHVPALRSMGFREVLVLPFWGHGYFDRLPVVREADRWLNRLAARRDWRAITTYAFVVVRK